MNNPAGTKTKYQMPPTYDPNGECVILCVPVSFIPFFRRFFGGVQERQKWETREDWYQAYQVFAEMEAELMSGCLSALVESNDRLYRLLDAALNGTVYSADGSIPPVVTPAIPAAPGAVDGVTAGLRKQLLDAQGILPAGWFDWGSAPATTADLVRAMRNDTKAQVDRAKNAVTLLQEASQASTIFGTVTNFLEQGAEVTAEGGIMATLLISIMSNAAMMGLQAGQLDDLLAKMDRLITSLDGGATPAPATNVIAELQSTNTLLG